MDITLDENCKKHFINSISSDIDPIKSFKVYTCTNYLILHNLLEFIPKDVVNIIHDYTKDEYTFNCDIHSHYEEHSTKGILKKQIIIQFDSVVYNNTEYSTGADIFYTFHFKPKEYYKCIVANSSLSSKIGLINNETSSHMFVRTNEFIDHSNIKCDENISKEMIDVTIFIVNDLMKIMINAGNFNN